MVQFAVLYPGSKNTASVLAGTPVGNQLGAVFQLLPEVGRQYLVFAGILVGVNVGVTVGVFDGVAVAVFVGVAVGVSVGVTVET
jgi:hypothetical protein